VILYLLREGILNQQVLDHAQRNNDTISIDGTLQDDILLNRDTFRRHRTNFGVTVIPMAFTASSLSRLRYRHCIGQRPGGLQVNDRAS
jgi:hypothetical protein